MVLEHLTTAVVVVDRQRIARYLNAAAEDLFETSARAALDRSVHGWLPRSLTDRIARALDEGERWTARELSLVTAGMKRLTVDVAVGPAGDDRVVFEFSGLDRYLRISRDDALRVQHEATQALARGLAHEIKNPLGGVRGAAQLLERRLPDDALREYTRVIIGEADRLGALVDAMLGPARPPVREPVNIHEVTEQVATLVAAEAPALMIERAYDPSLPMVGADRDHLVQALLNLVRNAADAVERHGRIALATRIERQVTIGGARHRQVLCVDVIDDGPGIPPERQAAVFLPLVTTRAEGSGLGLPIAQTLVARHGGLIECASEPGNTRFTMMLPMEAA